MSTKQNEHSPTPSRKGTDATGTPEFLGLAGQVFRTREGTTFIETTVGLRRETMRLTSKTFRQVLQSKMHRETGKMPSQAKIGRTIDLLEAHASQSAPVAEVHVRVAKDGNYVYIDLADDLGRAVEISQDGWRVIDLPPVRFLRTPSMRPLPAPRWGGTTGELLAFFNFAHEDDFVLILGWVLGALYDNGPHPGLVISGE